MVILESRKGMQGENQILKKSGAVAYINEYYPFGLQNQQTSSTQYGSKEQRYKFGSKELFKDFKLEQLDFGARMYNPQIGRWSVVDKMASDMTSWSPYNYAFNNPIRFIDPDGNAPDDYYLDAEGNLVDHVKNDKPDRVLVENNGGKETHAIDGVDRNFSEVPGLAMIKVLIDDVGLIGHSAIGFDNKTFGFYPTDANGDDIYVKAEMYNSPLTLKEKSQDKFDVRYPEANEYYMLTTAGEKSKLEGWLKGQDNLIKSGKGGEYSLFGNNCTTKLCEGLGTMIGKPDFLSPIFSPKQLNVAFNHFLENAGARVKGMK
jgi:RHS repeat-associated protein